MSIVCACIKNGTVAISADTQSNAGSMKIPGRHFVDAKKIHAINGSVIGLVGWSAISDLVTYLMANRRELFRFDTKPEILTTLLALQKVLKDEYYIKTDDDEEEQPVETSHVHGLIINRNGIFEITGYREVNHYAHYFAIGSGSRLALGAMHALFDGRLSAKQIVEAGVKAAVEFDDSCGLPLNTRTIRLRS